MWQRKRNPMTSEPARIDRVKIISWAAAAVFTSILWILIVRVVRWILIARGNPLGLAAPFLFSTSLFKGRID